MKVRILVLMAVVLFLISVGVYGSGYLGSRVPTKPGMNLQRLAP